MALKMEKGPLKQLEKDLKVFAARSLPYAARDALNKSGWAARGHAQDNIRKKFIERNKWTRGSVRVRTTANLRVDQMEVEVGSTEEYMGKQETGGIKRSRTGRSVAIPTAYSAGQEGARERTRLPRRPNRVKNIQLKQGRQQGKTRKQALVIAVNMAVREKKRFLYLGRGQHGGKRGIYRVVGGRYRGSGWPGNAKLRMVASYETRIVRIRESPWLRPAADRAMRGLDRRYAQALLTQFRRQRIFQNK